jgi:hypothetical protein
VFANPRPFEGADNGHMEEREMIVRWVEAWKQAGPELEAIRRREIQQADN